MWYLKFNNTKKLLLSRYNIFLYFFYDFFFPYSIHDRNNKGRVLLIASFERRIRQDYIDHVKNIASFLNSKNIESDFLIIKRCFLLVKLISGRRSAVNLLPKLLKDINGLIVHCDTTILENYIVNTANDKKIETFSLQHGFFPHYKSSKQWYAEYEYSNSNNMFLWDFETMSYYSKLHPKRDYFVVGTPKDLNSVQDLGCIDIFLKDKGNIFVYLPHEDHALVFNAAIFLCNIFHNNTVNFSVFIHPSTKEIPVWIKSYSCKENASNKGVAIYFRTGAVFSSPYEVNYFVNDYVEACDLIKHISHLITPVFGKDGQIEVQYLDSIANVVDKKI